MKRIIILALLGLAASASVQQAAGQTVVSSLSKASADLIDEVAKQKIDSGTAGLAIAIMRDGHLVFARGYGMANLEDNTPVTADTVFRIGSSTKQFTAAAIMLLVEGGKMSVNDKLSKFFPEFPSGDEVTVRQLLNHTSGIHDYTDTNDFHQAVERFPQTTAKLVKFIEDQPQLYDFSPGSKVEYTNSGYYLLGAIVEKISGISLQDFFKKNIFDKLGMKNTSIDDNAAVVPHRAAGYQHLPDHPNVLSNADYISMTTPGGAGGLRSTVGDLVLWQNALVSGKVVSPESVLKMTTPGKLNNGEPTKIGSGLYGYGLDMDELDGHHRISHGGEIYGYTSELETFPQDHVTISILFNTNGTAGTMKNDIARIVLGISPNLKLN